MVVVPGYFHNTVEIQDFFNFSVALMLQPGLVVWSCTMWISTMWQYTDKHCVVMCNLAKGRHCL